VIRHRGALLALVVLLGAVVPYLPTIDDYFVQDDFGVVSLLSTKPVTYFPLWVRESLDGRHLGLFA
jgi:hypothetical protein